MLKMINSMIFKFHYSCILLSFWVRGATLILLPATVVLYDIIWPISQDICYIDNLASGYNEGAHCTMKPGVSLGGYLNLAVW